MWRLSAVFVVVACSNGHGVAVDGAPVDAPSADVPDGSAAAVSISIIGWGGGTGGAPSPSSWGPFAGVPVYFQNSDSSLVARVMTDANGVASAVMDGGGFVTTSNPLLSKSPNFDDVELVTYAGVQPGDHLMLTDYWTNAVDVTVKLPPDGDSNYVLSASCNSVDFDLAAVAAGAIPTRVISLGACGGMADLVVRTTNPQNGSIRNTLLARDQPITAGGTIDLSAMTYVPYTPAAHHVHLTGIPSGVTTVSVTSFVVTRDVLLTYAPPPLQTPNGGVVDVTLTTVPLSNVQVQTRVSMSGTGGQSLELWSNGATSDPLSVDVSTLLLPNRGSTNYDAPTRTLRWTTSGTGVAIDDLTAGCQIVRPGMQAIPWYVAAPHAGDSFTAPMFAASADFPGSSQECSSVVFRSQPGGFDAFRPMAFAIQPASAPPHDSAPGDIVAE